MKRAFIVMILAAACSDSASKPAVDAPSGGPACTNATFDPCTTNTDCTSMNCKLFNSSALQVCTVTCTPGDNTTCPMDVSGAHATCNNMGICKPTAANNCHR